MKVVPSILMFSAVVIFAACTDQSYVEEKPHSGKLSDDNVFKGYETPLDKARGVEQTILDATQQRQKEREERGY